MWTLRLSLVHENSVNAKLALAIVSKGLAPPLRKMASFLAFQINHEMRATLLRKVTASFEPRLSKTSEVQRKADSELPLSPFSQTLHPNHTALVHEHAKRRCSMDSTFSSHNGHELDLAHLLMKRFSLVATAFLPTPPKIANLIWDFQLPDRFPEAFLRFKRRFWLVCLLS